MTLSLNVVHRVDLMAEPSQCKTGLLKEYLPKFTFGLYLYMLCPLSAVGHFIKWNGLYFKNSRLLILRTIF